MNIKKIALTFFLLSLSLLTPNYLYAKTMAVEKGIATIAKDEVVDDDLFIAGETVQIDGTVNGDVYAGGETVRINGTVNGDLHVGAGRVLLNGSVTEDVYIAAGEVTVSGATIGDSLLIGAGTANIDDESSIGGSLLAGTGNLMVYAPIKRNLYAGTGTVELNSTVGGEVGLGGGEINVGGDTKIGKNLYYALGENETEAEIAQTASVGGVTQRINHNFDTSREREKASTAMNGARTVSTIVSLLGALLVGYLGLRFFPNLFAGSAQKLSTSFFKCLGIGFLITIASLPVLILLAVTGVGLPLAGLLFLLLLLGVYLSKLVVGLSLGQWLSLKLGQNKMSPIAILALGLITFYLLKLIPGIGLFVSLITLWSGLGAFSSYIASSVNPKK